MASLGPVDMSRNLGWHFKTCGRSLKKSTKSSQNTPWPLLEVEGKMAKISHFWATISLWDVVESQRVCIISKYCQECVQLHQIHLRIQYGTLKWHSLAVFEKSLKKYARGTVWGGVKKKSPGVYLIYTMVWIRPYNNMFLNKRVFSF